MSAVKVPVQSEMVEVLTLPWGCYEVQSEWEGLHKIARQSDPICDHAVVFLKDRSPVSEMFIRLFATPNDDEMTVILASEKFQKHLEHWAQTKAQETA